MSPRSDGKRGRGRKTDPAEETATWLLEMEQREQAERHDEEEWAQQLRSTRAASATGQFPAVPMEGPGGEAAPAPPVAPAPPLGGYPSGGEATGPQRPLGDFPDGYGTGGYSGGDFPSGYSGSAYSGGAYSGGAYPGGEFPSGGSTSGDYPGGGYPSGESTAARPQPGEFTGGASTGGAYTEGESTPIHPPLAERYRSAGRATPRPAPAPATDPGATAWSWEPPQSAGSTGYEASAGAAWEPGLQAQPQPQGLSDQQFGSPAPWETDDPGLTAPPAEPQPWDTASESEHWGGKWPFEETTQSWEADDRSWLWPTQEAPSNTGSWEADPPAWRSQPGQGQATGTDPGGSGSSTAWAPGGTTGQIYGYPDTGGQPGLGGVGAGPAHSDPAYGYDPAPLDPPGSGFGGGAAPAGPGPEPWADGSGRAWYEAEAPPSEPVGVLEGDDEQVVRLGRAADDDPMGLGRMDGSRAQAARSMRTGEARRVPPSGDYHATWRDHGGRSRWPRVVALISWIILLMVVCWFYVFPWLERILPENF